MKISINKRIENDSAGNNGIVISPESVSRWLGGVVVFLLGMHFFLQAVHFYYQELPWLLRELFDVDEEESFATWFSTILLFFSCSLLFLIAHSKKMGKEPFLHHWVGLAWGFGFLSVDEAVGLHETFNTVTDYPWTIPGGILTLFLFLVFIKFLLHLPRSTRILFLIAGTAFVGGAVVVEHLADYYVAAFEMDNFGYQVVTALEETLEMAGVIIFIHALLKYLALDMKNERPLVFHFKEKSVSSA